jgi:Beta-galactosidase/beta-glucuronidase
MPLPGLLLCLMGCCIAMACRHAPAARSTGQPPKKVEVRHVNGVYRLYRNGQPFFVKGGAGYTHISELAACGGNTLRTWDTTGLQAILDEAHRHQLSVIVGLDIPPSRFAGSFYNDTGNVQKLITGYRSIIQQYKDHPALLLWCLGNELGFPYRPKFAPFYKACNQLLAMIHEEDPGHPVTTALMNLQRKDIINIKMKLRGLDFLSINTFNGLKTLNKMLDDLDWLWDGPYLLTEWAPEGSWESPENKWQAPIENTSTGRAAMFRDFYQNWLPQTDPRFMGSLAFYWGARQECTHSWFSIFNEDGHPTEVMEILRDCWNDIVTEHQSAKIQYMLLDEKGAADNILLSPGSVHKARLLLPPGERRDSLIYKWEIVREDWWGYNKSHWKKPEAEKGLLNDSITQEISFSTPRKEGPYRLFATVINSKGFCTTTNTPFYVVE